MEKAVVGPDVAMAVGYGRMLAVDMLAAGGASGPGPWAVLAEDGRLLAVYQAHGAGQAKPAVVLA
jgi:hypothetical protein